MEPIRINYGELRISHCARGRSVSLNVTVPPLSTKQTSSNSHVAGKRLLFRPLTGATDAPPVGIARATNGDVTPAGEKFSEILAAIMTGTCSCITSGW
jgi:hypothetical protein